MKLTRALKDFTDLENWVAWKYRDGKKVPYDPNRPKRRADVGDPRTWGAYEEASGADLDGVGIVLLDSGLGAIDLDDCRDPRTGALDDWACEIVKDAMGAYVEVSPSGKGLHILGLARGPQVHRCIRRGIGKVEVYRDCPRYITVTGDVFGRPCRSLANIDGLIDDLAPPRAPQTAGSVDLEAAWTLEWRDVIDRRRARGDARGSCLSRLRQRRVAQQARR